MRLVNLIEENTHEKCWFDLDGIESSVQFVSKICNAIDKAKVVLFMHSSMHLSIDFENDWTIKELNYARAMEKRVVLIKLDDAPLRIFFLLEYGSKNNIDASNSMQVEKLIKDLRLWINGDSTSASNDISFSSPNLSIGKKDHKGIMQFKLEAGTNVGLIRTRNDDMFLASADLKAGQWFFPQSNEFVNLGQYGALLVVADGENKGGDVASAIAVETIQLKFTNNSLKWIVNDDIAIRKFLIDAVKSADLNIYNRSKTDKLNQGMTASIVLAWILANKVYVCWCGNCRCYKYRNSKMVQVTKDHSYVQELVDKAIISVDEMRTHPLSNVLLRCLGDLEKRAQPDIRQFELHGDETILLCSDGLYKPLDDIDIYKVIRNNHSLNECKNELISVALKKGGDDNITVVVLETK